MLSRAFPPHVGGVSTHVSYLAEALSTLTKSKVDGTRVCRVEVVAATARGRGSTSEARHPVGPPGTRPFLVIHRMPGEKAHFTPTGAVPFEQPIKYLFERWHEIKPDLIHAHDFEAALIGLMLKTAFRKPLVFTVHRTPKEPDPTLCQRDAKSCFLSFLQRSGLVDKVVAPSDAYKQHILEQGFESDEVVRIHHGVPVRKLQQIGDRPKVLERFQLDPADELILCPARLDPHKAPEVLIDAAAIVKKSMSGRRLVFVIAGSGEREYRSELQKRAKSKGVAEIVRLGASDGKDLLPEHMPTLYRRAKVCVLPSKREGFPQALLEAAAFGCPVIGANTGGIPEIITRYCTGLTGPTGLLFTRDEPEDLAYQLRRLLEDGTLCGMLAANAAAQLNRRFDAEIMAREYLRLYQKVASIRLI